MVVLLVNNGRKDKDFYKSIFSRFAEDDTIIELYSIPEANNFLSSNLAGGKNRIDLVFTNFDFGDDIQTATDLIIWLKGSHELSYYDQFLRLSSLPIILVQSSASSTETDRLLGFDRIIKFNDLDNSNRVRFVVESTIKSWVSLLLADYELLELLLLVSQNIVD